VRGRGVTVSAQRPRPMRADECAAPHRRAASARKGLRIHSDGDPTPPDARRMSGSVYAEAMRRAH
jgi:hypothetical protein